MNGRAKSAYASPAGEPTTRALAVTERLDGDVEVQEFPHAQVSAALPCQVIDTLKFAAAAADAIKAPVCALSCTPNSIPISAGGLLIDRSWAIKLAAAGVTAP